MNKGLKIAAIFSAAGVIVAAAASPLRNMINGKQARNLIEDARDSIDEAREKGFGSGPMHEECGEIRYEIEAAQSALNDLRSKSLLGGVSEGALEEMQETLNSNKDDADRVCGGFERFSSRPPGNRHDVPRHGEINKPEVL